MITMAQIRHARKLLGWSRDQLAAKAGLTSTHLRYLENGERELLPEEGEALRAVFESAGVEFTNGDAPGVRLRATGQRAR
jgi:transcriptional regulator with XRE-family HTH domain